MSKINDLINKLCPNGVEFKSLDKISSITTGKLNANAMVEDGEYAFFTCDAKPFRIDKYAFDGEAILISGNGSQVGHLNYYIGKFNAYQRTYVLMSFIDSIIPKYLYHYLNTYLKGHIDENSKKGSIPYITLPMLQGFNVPIPPLEVQNEIVRILDKFGELEAELEAKLEAELEARRSQYEFWRGRLLNKEYEIKFLPELATNLDNKRKPVTKSDRESGNYPYYGASGIADYVSNYIFDDDLLLVSEDGANLKARSTPIAFSSVGKVWINNHAHVLKFDNMITQKYVEHYLNMIDLNEYITGAAQPKLNQENLNKIRINIPSSIEEQEKVVIALERFNKLINDINIGLSAEIELRKKQYEYYRNKMLSFEEV